MYINTRANGSALIGIMPRSEFSCTNWILLNIITVLYTPKEKLTSAQIISLQWSITLYILTQKTIS